VDTPTQNLESYFLEVVQKARTADAVTSGAQSGARVAEYLRGTAEQGASTERILDRLTAPQAAPAIMSARAEPTETVDSEKLAALTKTTSAPAPKPQDQPSSDPKPADLEKANEKLASFLKPKDAQ
jgi:hypothetical protein